MIKNELLQLVEKIDREEVIRVVRDLVRIPSINPPGREKEVAEYIKAYMRGRNIETKIVEAEENRYNVVARLKGKGEISPIVFTGHMDVVPISEEEGKRWSMDPFSGEIIEGYLYGRGSSDMKGGLGAAMVTMGTLAREGITPPGDIILVATVDEENLMRGAKVIIASRVLEDAKKVVVCEPTNLELVTACKGRTWADIIVKGKTAHTSQQGAGINAIERANLLIDRIMKHKISQKRHPILGNSFWQVVAIHAGVEPILVPDSCTVTVDARLAPGQRSKDVWNQMEQMIDSMKIDVPNFEAEIHIIEEREPWEASSKDQIVKNIENAFDILQLPLKQSGFLGTTDGTVFRKAGMDAVILGPGDLACVHKENERIAIKQLIQGSELYLLTMLGA